MQLLDILMMMLTKILWFLFVGPQWAISLILLLEFALVSGLDWWDLLVTTQHSSILTLTDRLADTFHQHSAPLTQHLHTSFLVLKTSMLRWVISNG